MAEHINRIENNIMPHYLGIRIEIISLLSEKIQKNYYKFFKVLQILF